MTTWNPIDKSNSISLSGGDLVATATDTSWKSARANTSANTGKIYFEGKVTVGSDGNYLLGIGNAAALVSDYCGGNINSWGWGHVASLKFHNSSQISWGTAPTLNSVIMLAWNADTGKLWFGKDGTWFSSGDPANDANPAYTGVTGTLFPMVSIYSNNSAITANFSTASFVYTPPTGFSSIESMAVIVPLFFQPIQMLPHYFVAKAGY